MLGSEQLDAFEGEEKLAVDRPLSPERAVVIEHGMGGARAAAPVAKSMMTYLYDPAKAMEELTALEAGWGGDVNTRMARKAAAWKAASDPKAAVQAAAEGSVEIRSIDGSASLRLPMDANITIHQAGIEAGMVRLVGEARVSP
jgi:hypothetical protein